MAANPNTDARSLSKLGASKGGRARASVLTAEERRESARRAARARWGKDDAGEAIEAEHDLFAPLLQSPDPSTDKPYSMFSGTLHIGDVPLRCHVLNDGRRVLTQREVARAISGGRVSGSYLQNIPGFDVASLPARVIHFTDPAGPQVNHGFEATLLIEICEAYLAARDRQDGSLRPNQERIARAADLIVRACARVGIEALIDEATGYQEVRARNALQVKLQLFIAEQMGEWAKRFPDEFWVQLARLEGVRYSSGQRPWRWGKYVMRFVYQAIDPDVSKRLADINPAPARGHNHHQHLTKFGQKELNNHLLQLIAVMRLCNDMDEFKRKFPRAFPTAAPLQLELTGPGWDD
jgi:P63C domain